MYKRDLVSIIIPVYDVEKYIGNCIESIIKQTYTNWELILIDDHSQDGSYEICRKYAETNEKIFSSVNPEKGVSSARNEGVLKATGEWLLFIDSDDELLPDALEKLVENNNYYDLVVGGFIIIDIGEDNRKEFYPEYFEGNITEFCRNIDKYTSTTPYMQGPCWKLFKLKKVRENNILFPKDLSYGEDAYFVYDYLSVAEKVKVISNLTYIYYNRGTSLSHGFKVEKYKINLMLNKKLYELCKSHGIESYDSYLNNNRNSFSSYINELALSDYSENKIHVIREAARSKETKECFRLKNQMEFKKRVIGLMVLFRADYLLYTLACFNTKRY